MFRLIAIISLAFSAAAVLGHPRRSRIVGGNDVDIEDFPYQVSLEVNGEPTCGGSIISEKYIVTSAQCTQSLTEEDIAVRAGSSIKSSGGTLIGVKTIHHNPNYDASYRDQDVSVLELDQPLLLGLGIQAIALPNRDEALEEGVPVTVSGWGDLWNWMNGTAIRSDRLQAVEVHVVAQDLCRLTYSAVLYQQITDAMLCAGDIDQVGKSFCYGDDGGPLVHEGKLRGIVSWGFMCFGMVFPGVYTNVADGDVRGFIQSVTGI